jgi:hypothetical protein
MLRTPAAQFSFGGVRHASENYNEAKFRIGDPEKPGEHIGGRTGKHGYLWRRIWSSCARGERRPARQISPAREDRAGAGNAGWSLRAS